MKHLKYLIISFLLLNVNFSLFAEGNHRQPEIIINRSSISEYNIQLSKEQTVYICSGAYAYAYHSKSDCPGLNNCKGEIRYTDEYSAVNSYGRRPCCRCWSNVSGNCKDDNTSSGGGYGGGGSDGEAYAYLALAIVTTSAIILSNDVYLYPAISFYSSLRTKNSYDQPTNNRIGKGWIFGFRKTFTHSALEYGVSHLKFETSDNYANGYSENNVQVRWGWHLNYVHQVFYNKTPEWLKVYLGPSVNSVLSYGYGGIVGTQMKLFDRLRFDFRYELTTQTNQIQAGMIFTYQKKYFWQKNR